MEPQENNIGSYYQRINQLTPVVGQTKPGIVHAQETMPVTAPAISLFTPIAIVIAGLFGTLAVFTAIKYRDFQKSIAIMGLSLLIAIIPFGAKLILQPTQLDSKASPELTPQNILINELTATSFTISWETATTTQPVLQVSLDPDFAAITKSQSDSQPTLFHQQVVADLTPATTYYLRILSGDQWYDNAGQPITVTTK